MSSRTLNFILSASANKFAAGLNRAKVLASSAGSFIKSALSVSTTSLGFVGLTGAVGSLVSGVKEAADEIDDLSKAAGRVGVTTEFMTGLAHGADLAGVPVDELVTDLQKLNQQLGDAKVLESPLADTLRRIGLDARRLAELNAEQRIYAIADAVKDLDATTRTSVLRDLFGKAGDKLGGAFAGGADGIREMVAEAKALGIAVDDLGGKRVEEMNDAISRVYGVWKGINRIIVTELAPHVGAVADALRGWVIEGKFLDSLRWIVQQVPPTVAAVAAGIADAVDWVGKLVDRMGDLISRAEKLAGVVNVAGGLGMGGGGALAAMNAAGWLGLGRGGDGKVAAAARPRGAGDPIRAIGDRVAGALAALNERAAAGAAANKAGAAQGAKPGAAGPGLLGPMLKRLEGAGQAIIDRGRAEFDSRIRAPFEIAKKGAQDFWKAVEEGARKAKADADALRDATRSPLEQFRESLKRADFLFKERLIDAKVAGRGRLDAVRRLEEATGMTNVRRTAGVVADRGSAEAYRLIFNAQQRRADDVQRRSANYLKELVDLAKKHDERLDAEAAGAEAALGGMGGW